MYLSFAWFFLFRMFRGLFDFRIVLKPPLLLVTQQVPLPELPTRRLRRNIEARFPCICSR